MRKYEGRRDRNYERTNSRRVLNVILRNLDFHWTITEEIIRFNIEGLIVELGYQKRKKEELIYIIGKRSKTWVTKFPPKEHRHATACMLIYSGVAASKPSLEGKCKRHHSFCSSYMRVPSKVLSNSKSLNSWVRPRFMFWLYYILVLWPYACY